MHSSDNPADGNKFGTPSERAGRFVVAQAQHSGRPGWARVLLWLGLCVGAMAVTLVGFGFLIFTRSIATFEMNTVGKADGIVVLTGGTQRLADGLGLLANGHGRRLLISGVYEKTNRDEIARHTADRHGALDCCVDLGKGARNTIGNAIEARRWANANGFKSLLVVTSNYHMPRTLKEFEHALGDISLIGYPVVTDSVDVMRMWSDASVLRIIASEYSKFLVSKMRRAFEVDPETSRLPVLVGRQKPVGPRGIERAATP